MSPFIEPDESSSRTSRSGVATGRTSTTVPGEPPSVTLRSAGAIVPLQAGVENRTATSAPAVATDRIFRPETPLVPVASALSRNGQFSTTVVFPSITGTNRVDMLTPASEASARSFQSPAGSVNTTSPPGVTSYRGASLRNSGCSISTRSFGAWSISGRMPARAAFLTIILPPRPVKSALGSGPRSTIPTVPPTVSVALFVSTTRCVPAICGRASNRVEGPAVPSSVPVCRIETLLSPPAFVAVASNSRTVEAGAENLSPRYRFPAWSNSRASLPEAPTENGWASPAVSRCTGAADAPSSSCARAIRFPAAAKITSPKIIARHL
ncbi:MAG: hypothetical protein BWY66_02416 [bacterium ADurb.Bin374]|nr:MAG: hypothetical protein BWY66_02416 [bacterium ADurb.Bin374]